MKAVNPIKRHKALVSFSKDHHFGLLLVWKIRQGFRMAVTPERVSNYVLHFFDHDLSPHFKDEEMFLFSQLPGKDLMKSRAMKEHQSIYTLIENIRSNKNNPAMLTRLADELESHIRFEERELFNHIQKHGNSAWMDSASRVANDSRAIDDNWPDAFWNK